MKKVLKIIALVVLLALSAGFITVMVKTDFFRDLGAVEIPIPSLPGIVKDPYLEVGGEKYTSGVTELPEGQVRIDVKETDTFTVNIVPSGKSFDFRHNGALTKFPYGLEADWNSIFKLEVGEGYFNFDNSKQMMYVLAYIFPGEEITELNGFESSAAYFNIEVNAGDDILIVPLSGFYGYMKIDLSDEYIVF